MNGHNCGRVQPPHILIHPQLVAGRISVSTRRECRAEFKAVLFRRPSPLNG
jgi:hypothetical protein